MRALRAETLEEQRKSKMQQIVLQIYNSAVSAAKSTNDSKYLYELRHEKADFQRTNMSEILAEVQSLFPDCSVTHTILTRTPDGKLCDISKIDEHLKPFVMNQLRSNEYIVVDWS